VTTYQAAWRGWDFSKATTCIFVQQPWLEEYKAHTLGQFFNWDMKRTKKLRVYDVNQGELINHVVREITRAGQKIRLRLIHELATQQRVKEIEGNQD
jgi:hypothetical protein